MKLILSVFSILVGCAAETPKCSIYDSECQKALFQGVGRRFAYTGLPALGISIIDPYQLYNDSMSILGLWNLTLVRGEAQGIGKCIVTNYTADMKTRHKTPEVICNPIVIKGHYTLIPAPIIKETCGFNFNADGNITITFEDWYFKFVYPFQIVKHNDGKIYVEALFNKATYTTSVGKVTVQADGIKIGKVDISVPATEWLNDNWKLLMDSDIGKYIKDKSAFYYYEIYGTFFDRMPAVNYYSDDFTSLVEN